MSNDVEVMEPHRQHPLVSVIVVTYKRPAMLARALDSVLAQTWRDMEVWVVHDGPSDDDIISVYERYEVEFEQAGIDFYSIDTDEHSGYYCYPRNSITENARGVYIANLDDDNEWAPDALESLVKSMDEGEMWPDLVYGRRRYVIDEGAPREFNGMPLADGESPYVPWDDVARSRLAISPQFNFIDSSDFLVSKAAMYRLALQTGMMWNEGKRRFGDHELVARMAWFSDLRFKSLDKVISIYHIHGANVSLTRPTGEMPRAVTIDEAVGLHSN